MCIRDSFITGSDNGNISLWSLSKKKPIFTQRVAHGIIPLPASTQISAEASEVTCQQQLQDKNLTHPYWITSLHAIPYSNVFVSGSWNGSLKLWKISENLREFEILAELPNCRGLVTNIQAVESLSLIHI